MTNNSPAEIARLREKALAAGLCRLAAAHDVEFVMPLFIDARGEISLFLLPGFAYGEKLASLIAQNGPRYGRLPCNYCEPSAAWCYMNHFSVARMLEMWEPGTSYDHASFAQTES